MLVHGDLAGIVYSWGLSCVSHSGKEWLSNPEKKKKININIKTVTNIQTDCSSCSLVRDIVCIDDTVLGKVTPLVMSLWVIFSNEMENVVLKSRIHRLVVTYTGMFERPY